MASVDGLTYRVRGRGRGVLALNSFDPLPRPSKILYSKQDTSNDGKSKIKKIVLSKDIRKNVTIQKFGCSTTENGENGGCRCMAKYNFSGNPNQPGGFMELDIKQGEYLTLLKKCHVATKNHLWWEVKNNCGNTGFVPANYCMLIDSQPTALPWLENNKEAKTIAAEEKEEKENLFGVLPTTKKIVVKQYQSAYAENKTTFGAGNKRYYCELCDKQLNGPTPYNMHMTSKAHKEEEEYLKSCAS